MNVVNATRAYEAWLGTQVELVPEDVEEKHRLMGRSAFVCLRATHYRWLQHAGDVGELAAPELACVGDLHAAAALAPVLPANDWTYETRRRVAGVGSLGRRRLVLVGDHGGAPVARELKQLSPPAGVWLGRPASARVPLEAAVRAQDPFGHVAAGWAARRLAPDCVKLDLGHAPGRAAERRLLACMGRETANIHLASPDAIGAVRADLDRRRADWLHAAAAHLARATRRDHDAWRHR